MLDFLTAAQSVGATLKGNNARFQRVTTDSRNVRAGDLFVGIRGDKFDGRMFANQARASDPSGVMVQPGAKTIASNAAVIEVTNTRLALGTLAAFWRARFSSPLIAITGSNGKTT